MTVTKTIRGKCSKCGTETDHDIVAMKADGIGFCIGLECPVCGKLVPEVAWSKYQKTGDVVVPNLMRQMKSGNPMKATPGRYI